MNAVKFKKGNKKFKTPAPTSSTSLKKSEKQGLLAHIYCIYLIYS